jgi:hypothetical protein
VRLHFKVAITAIFSLVATTQYLARQAPSAPGGQAAEGYAAKQPFSVRVVAYTIDAHLDPTNHKIQGKETLVYRNLTSQPLDVFPFHLYLNAFQPKATFMREHRLNNPDYQWKPESFGAINVESFSVGGMGDLTSQMQFIQPDDGNSDDRTVFQIHLPKPIPPNGDVKFDIAFEDTLPLVVARTGYIRDFFMVGQWFPKVGVWWHGAWNCHQFHHTTEFFADFGTFDVNITVPKNFVLGAGGDLVSSHDNSDGTKTAAYHSEDVHDFSWTASPSFDLVEDSWTGSAGAVKIHLLMSPGHEATTARYLYVIKGTLNAFDQWYGPYPYGRLTIVDPPHGGFAAGGMEYPTLITADTDRIMPVGVLLPELVLEHEFGHQYWYGMVATNEFEDAWLDEGINSYTEVKVMDALYGKNTSELNLHALNLNEDNGQRLAYLSEPDYDPVTRFAWQFVTSGSYGGITYGKTATVLLTLEEIIGEDTMRRALHTYFMRYRFTHPTGEDFLKTIEEVSGQDLRWYFNQAVYGTNLFDYAVEDVQSDRADWYDPHPPREKSGVTVYNSSVVVHRKQDFVFPVDLVVNFDNGEVVEQQWDGKDRWTRFRFVKPAKIVSVEIDPGGQIPLDKDPFNNSYIVKADTRASRKLTYYWMFLTEWLAQILALLV